MLAWARRIADGQWPYRDFWANYAPGPAARARRAGQALRAVAAVVAHRARRDRCDRLRARLRLRAPARWHGLGARRMAGGGRRDGVADRSRPQRRRRSRLRSARCWPRARAAGRGRAGRAGDLRAAGDRRGSGDRRGARGARAARRRRAPRASPSPRRPSRCSRSRPSPSWPAATMVDQVLGFAAKQDLQRLPFPLDYDGGFDPTSCSSSTSRRSSWPAARCGRRGRWRAAGRGRAGGAGRRRAWPTCSPAPTSSTSCRSRSSWPIALACAAGRERNACCGPRWASCWRSSRCTASSGASGRRAIRPRWRRSPPRRPTACAPRRPTPPRCARSSRYVRARAPGGAPVLVAPPRYDRVRVGDPMLNVLLDRPNPTRYDVIQPGVVTTAKVQREMARDLRAAPRRRALALAAGARARAQRLGALERRVRPRPRDRARLPAGGAVR